MTNWMQCDCCSRLTDRLHHGEQFGLEYAACDQCCGYEPEAYGEPPARYLDEQVDPRELEYEMREPDPKDTP